MHDYQLIDFGDQEKLERFGRAIVRRETPAAVGKRALNRPRSVVASRLLGSSRNQVSDWKSDLVWTATQPHKGNWTGVPPEHWQASFGPLVFQLKTTPSGQVGLFPEQSTNWDWISHHASQFAGLKAINLFGYTGGTTLALAATGAEVVHVDAAKSVVNWARENAAASKLADRPVRWIVEDAMRFVKRELKRGNRYDIVVADPPSFGRGPGGESWKIQRDLDELIAALADLTGGNCRGVIISCHTPEIGLDDLSIVVARHFGNCGLAFEPFQLSLQAASGKQLPSGVCVRAVAASEPPLLRTA